jgi:hypothetical protein
MPVIFAADQRSKKFRVETAALLIVIVRGGRAILSFEFFREACPEQALPNRRFLVFQFRRDGNISIESCQRRIVQLPRPCIESVQAVRPTPDQNRLPELWL